MLRKLFITSIILLALSAISISFADSGPNMKEGLWEITTKIEMPGMEMPAMKHTQCITKDALVPQSSQPGQGGQECKITETKVDGNTVTWAIECNDQGGKMKGTGKITYKGDSFEGVMTMSMPQANMEMTSHISGRRIGDCK
ncbi:MAG: DUF3617 domain-containing protein [Thermodesulfobacteriota bacterium]|nr:DUF3617 domain-containing protein [Thermodesulfobacteriota bacterium]